jgi:hypothetical protein
MSAPEILLPIAFTIITIASILILYWLLPQGNMIKCASQICSSYNKDNKDCKKHQVCGKECVVNKDNLCGAPNIPINSVAELGVINKARYFYIKSKKSYVKHDKGGPGISAAT